MKRIKVIIVALAMALTGVGSTVALSGATASPAGADETALWCQSFSPVMPFSFYNGVLGEVHCNGAGQHAAELIATVLQVNVFGWTNIGTNGMADNGTTQYGFWGAGSYPSGCPAGTWQFRTEYWWYLPTQGSFLTVTPANNVTCY